MGNGYPKAFSACDRATTILNCGGRLFYKVDRSRTPLKDHGRQCSKLHVKNNLQVWRSSHSHHGQRAAVCGPKARNFLHRAGSQAHNQFCGAPTNERSCKK